MSSERAIRKQANPGGTAFETRDFFLACFLRCAGYELVNLRDGGGARCSSFAIAPRGAPT